MVQKRKDLRKCIIKNLPLVIFTPALVCYLSLSLSLLLSYPPTFYFSYNVDIEIAYKKSFFVIFSTAPVPSYYLLLLLQWCHDAMILTLAHVPVLLIVTFHKMIPLKVVCEKNTIDIFTLDDAPDLLIVTSPIMML